LNVFFKSVTKSFRETILDQRPVDDEPAVGGLLLLLDLQVELGVDHEPVDGGVVDDLGGEDDVPAVDVHDQVPGHVLQDPQPVLGDEEDDEAEDSSWSRW
jgi:hypothetical protein